MAVVERPFHLFSKLPAELRLAIWRECLPHRVCELDVPIANIVFNLDYEALSPCKLSRTSDINACPPVISRVCRESRGVAFETGGYAESWPNIPEDVHWLSWNDWNSRLWWRDRARDSAHINWTPSYNADFESVGDPLKFLAWHTAKMSGCSSLMEKFLTYGSLRKWLPTPPRVQHNQALLNPLVMEDFKALERLPKCRVVVRMIIAHAEFENAASTGLFGLLGDACVQIVEVMDERRIDALFALAEESERKYQVTIGQDFQRLSVESIKQELKDHLLWKYHSESIGQLLRPAYMFRLCTAMCNQVGRKEPVRLPAVRGRGRGRGGSTGRSHG
ncbi:hypothetical protein MMC25_004063 [Agyrium rufum]|nr:hypothetical protein [Agyrium rufum]